MTCGVENISYEVLYELESSVLSPVSRLDNVRHVPDSTQQYEIRGLLPFTEYSVRVRVVGYVDGGDGMYRVSNGTQLGNTTVLSSKFSIPTVFTTQKSGTYIFTCNLTRFYIPCHLYPYRQYVHHIYIIEVFVYLF